MGEWVMPYDAVRRSADPSGVILAFLEGVYGVATTLGGWDGEAFTYKKPPAPPRKHIFSGGSARIGGGVSPS